MYSAVFWNCCVLYFFPGNLACGFHTLCFAQPVLRRSTPFNMSGLAQNKTSCFHSAVSDWRGFSLVKIKKKVSTISYVFIYSVFCVLHSLCHNHNSFVFFKTYNYYVSAITFKYLWYRFWFDLKEFWSVCKKCCVLL